MDAHSNSILSKGTDHHHSPYTPTKYRYFISALYCLCSMVTAIMWISTSPIIKTLENVYDKSIFTVNFCTSLIWFVLYPPMNFVANYVLDEKGLRSGVILGSVICIVGLGIRVFSKASFYYIFAGQLLGAIGQPFILNAPQKLSAVWYPPEERTLATTIASIANPVGVGVGFLLAQFFVEENASVEDGLVQVNKLMIFTGILGFLMILPSFFFFQNKPKNPPSKSADTEKYSYKESLRGLFSNKDYMIFVLSMGLFWGSYNVLATVLQPLIQPYGFTESDAGNFGAVTLLLGLIGSLVWGAYVNKTQKYKFSIVFCGCASLVGLAGLTYALTLKNLFIALAMTAFYGFFTTPVFALAFEFCAELSFPVAEAASSGLMIVMTQFGGLFATLGIDALLVERTAEHTLISCAILGFLSVLGLLGFVLTKEDLRRAKNENEGENHLTEDESHHHQELPGSDRETSGMKKELIRSKN